MQCGLLGRKLGHSYSPQIHSYLGEYTYSLFEKEPDSLEGFLRSGDYTGLNVTIPYKKDVLPYCDLLTDCAVELGAVNTIVRRADGKLIGHNTDHFGFLTMVNQCGLQVCGKKVLVLGSGGASATAVAVLRKLHAEVIVISRTGENNYDNLSRHNDAALIVNATPVGMYPNTGVSPVDLNCFPQLEGVLDIVYNPARTQLLLDAEKCGLISLNGLLMLVAQAKESAEWFTGSKIPDEKITEIYNILRTQMENIVLIGMPGCGKSTVGKLLAEYINKKFVDADTLIETQSGMTIPEIFSASGEEGFRQWESRILAHVGKESGCVIATGGGCVTRNENYACLHQNGRIIWIKRDIRTLPTNGRPLSQMNSLEQMYHIRRPLYEAFSDFSVENNSTPQAVVEQILEELL